MSDLIDVTCPNCGCKIHVGSSAKPERPRGKWIRITQGNTQETYICSICGRRIQSESVSSLIPIRYPFCHCGADMREGQDEPD